MVRSLSVWDHVIQPLLKIGNFILELSLLIDFQYNDLIINNFQRETNALTCNPASTFAKCSWIRWTYTDIANSTTSHKW